jgi:hypothetical protein
MLAKSLKHNEHIMMVRSEVSLLASGGETAITDSKAKTARALQLLRRDWKLRESGQVPVLEPTYRI